MKKILFAVLAASLFAGCDEYRPVERKNPASEKISCEKLGWVNAKEYDLVKVDDHVYLVVSGIRCVSIVHAESCPCKAKK